MRTNGTNLHYAAEALRKQISEAETHLKELQAEEQEISERYANLSAEIAKKHLAVQQFYEALRLINEASRPKPEVPGG